MPWFSTPFPPQELRIKVPYLGCGAYFQTPRHPQPPFRYPNMWKILTISIWLYPFNMDLPREYRSSKNSFKNSVAKSTNHLTLTLPHCFTLAILTAGRRLSLHFATLVKECLPASGLIHLRYQVWHPMEFVRYLWQWMVRGCQVMHFASF